MVENIKALCERHKITLKSLERELGFGNGTIARWDDNSPAISKVLKVADYFDVDVYTIIYGEKQKKPAGAETDGRTVEAIDLFCRLTPANRYMILVQEAAGSNPVTRTRSYGKSAEMRFSVTFLCEKNQKRFVRTWPIAYLLHTPWACFSSALSIARGQNFFKISRFSS